MARLTAPNGATVIVADAKVERLLGQGFTTKKTRDGETKRPDPDREDSPYKGLKVADLKALIAERNESRDTDAHIPTDGKLAELRAALEADDKALAAAAAAADEGADPDDVDTGEQ
jgi:hypothetical protein